MMFCNRVQIKVDNVQNLTSVDTDFVKIDDVQL